MKEEEIGQLGLLPDQDKGKTRDGRREKRSGPGGLLPPAQDGVQVIDGISWPRSPAGRCQQGK